VTLRETIAVDSNCSIMQTLWLVRHAHRLDFIQPEWFDTAVYPFDPPLSEQGQVEANALAEHLSQAKIDRIVTSPFLRTIQTAAPLARTLELPIQLEWGLCEWLCADWTPSLPTTTPVSDLKVDYPIDLFYQSIGIPVYPEIPKDLSLRTSTIAQRLLKSNYENIVAIGHKNATLGIVAALTGDDTWLSYDLPCAGSVKLMRNDGEELFRPSNLGC
jgi:broad specificity phosphatase PhoE